MEKSDEIKKTIHTVVCALLFAVVFISFVMYAYVAVNFFIDYGRQGTGNSGGENFGIGLSVGFGAVFMIIFGVAELVASMISIPLHIWLVKARRSVAYDGKVALIINAVLLILSVAAFAVMFIMTR